VDDSRDPNNLAGPAGFGTAGFVRLDQTFPYTVYFANEPTAKGPAAQVVITEQLDPHLDWSTFELGDFGFGSVIVQVPAGRSYYHTRLDERSTLGVFVDVTAGLDASTGLVTWAFTALDPTTLDIPANPAVGFLPPDDANRDGEGFASYFIRPKAADVTGTSIKAQAAVVFDTNAPINTPQVVNTIDNTVPTSSVGPLPATTTTPSFTVSWSGSDGAGSGIASFDVFVSDNGGPFQPFQTGTTATSATFTGQLGHTYAFFSLATSNVGLVQPTPMAAQTTTKVVSTPPTPTVVVTSVHWGTIKVKTGSGKRAKTKSEPALEITFSGALSGAGNLGAYQLASVTTKKVKKKTVKTLKPIRLSMVLPASSPTTTSVAILPAGKINLAQTDELQIIAADLIDAQGSALDGDDDGQPGGNFIAAFSRNGLTLARPNAILRATCTWTATRGMPVRSSGPMARF
jgi:hypothetical protein